MSGSGEIGRCVFCEIETGARPGHIFARTEDVFGFISLEGHPLIAPIDHIPALADLSEDLSASIMKLATRSAAALRQITSCEGVNLVLSDGKAAGQDVFHVHMHVKPRWTDDGVQLNWDTDEIADHDRSNLAAGLKVCF